MATERIGDYKITPLSDGKYSVALTNGSMGARVCTAEEVQQFRESMAGKQATKNNFSRFINPYEYEISASDNMITKFGKTVNNMTRLRRTEGLKGMELLNAKFHNLCAVMYNPFATAEVVKNRFHI